MQTFNLKNIVIIFAISLFILLFYNRCKRNYKVELSNKTGTINGRIKNYNNDCKNGMLIYFDAISRIDQIKVFRIDSNGNFSVSFNLPHATYNTYYLQLCDHVFTFFLEPGTDLQIKIQDDSIQFLSESGLSNRQLVILEDSLNKKFKRENEFLKTLKKDEFGFEEYISEHTKLAKKKMAFIDAYEKKHPLNQSVINVLKNDLHYSVAIQWIRYNTKYSDNNPLITHKLPENFYKDLFHSYNINNKNAIVSGNFNDYIANIRSIFSETEDFGTRADFIKNSHHFSNAELILIDGFFDKDTSCTMSNDEKFFLNNGFGEILFEYSKRYYVNNVLRKSEELPIGIGRDLIISQGLSHYYFLQAHIEPTENEWLKINELIESNFILNYLHQLNVSLSTDKPKNSSLLDLPKEVKISSDTLFEELLFKYQGNVVYVDFYSTWCIPCRKEIPIARKLANNFENKEVVFIYVCCQSEKKNWRKMVDKYQLKGDHYYLNEDEYTELSALYGLKGFPTYILIDKKGRVANKNASLPSSGSNIINEIQQLLEE